MVPSVSEKLAEPACLLSAHQLAGPVSRTTSTLGWVPLARGEVRGWKEGAVIHESQKQGSVQEGSRSNKGRLGNGSFQPHCAITQDSGGCRS